MNYSNIHTFLPLRFPELRESYEKEIHSFSDGQILQYVLFPCIFHEYLNDLLKMNTDKEMMIRIFSFYEEMALCKDEEVNNLLQVALLECLWDEKIVYERACGFMFPATKRINANIKNYLNEP